MTLVSLSTWFYLGYQTDGAYFFESHDRTFTISIGRFLVEVDLRTPSPPNHAHRCTTLPGNESLRESPPTGQRSTRSTGLNIPLRRIS